MARLTDRQRKQIIAEYVNGGVSQSQLAKKYTTTRKTISKILESKEVCKSIQLKKEENTLSTLEWLDEHNTEAQEIMGLCMDNIKAKLQSGKVSVKECAGAYKILAEIHGDIKVDKTKAEKVTEVKLVIEDASNGADD